MSGSGGGSGDRAEESMARLMDLLQRAADKGVNIQECFEFFDADKSGTIDEHEFRSGLKKLGVILTPTEVQDVMSKFEGKNKGMWYHLWRHTLRCQNLQ